MHLVLRKGVIPFFEKLMNTFVPLFMAIIYGHK